MSAKLCPPLSAAEIKLAEKASSGKPPLKNRDVLDRPTKRTAQQLDKLEKMAGGPLPLSLLAWYEEVGAVSLLGYPSTLLWLRIVCSRQVAAAVGRTRW
jgi:hypothetical protein